MEHVGALPSEPDAASHSEIYWCATDGYWRVHDNGQIERVEQR